MSNKNRVQVVQSALQACASILKEINYGTSGSTLRFLPIFIARIEAVRHKTKFKS
jgi:hypothetical protein